MRIVTAQELERWLASGLILEKDARGPKVLALPSGAFLKIFYTRRSRLQALLWPAAQRFAKNTRKLHSLGIASPSVTETFWIDRTAGLSGCLYTPLPGQSLEKLLQKNPATLENELPALADFIKLLHRNGIYFRSLHLGNILRLEQGGFGLIDVLDLQCFRRPLSKWKIQRNFQHMQSYLQRRKLQRFPLEKLIELYSH
jgi:hypothetical protein